MIGLMTRLARRNMLLLLAGAAVWFTGATPAQSTSAPAADDPRLKQRWRCGGGDCPGYEYDPIAGDPDHNAPAGTAFEDLDPDWYCPRCGAAKVEFRRLPPSATAK